MFQNNKSEQTGSNSIPLGGGGNEVGAGSGRQPLPDGIVPRSMAMANFALRIGGRAIGGNVQSQQQPFFCDLCQIDCCDIGTLKDHFQGIRHQRKLKFARACAKQVGNNSKDPVENDGRSMDNNRDSAGTDPVVLDSKKKEAKIAYLAAQMELAAAKKEEVNLRIKLLELEYQEKLRSAHANEHPLVCVCERK